MIVGLAIALVLLAVGGISILLGHGGLIRYLLPIYSASVAVGLVCSAIDLARGSD